jgi:4-amino-4-deoxy-L-arabinose transferase-like glycosyltransferase
LRKAASAAFFVRDLPFAMPLLRAPRPIVPETADPDTVSPSAPNRAWKQFGLVCLCGAWVLLGLFGRDPWKTEDAINFAVAWEMLQRSDLLVPHVAQEPAFSVAPLVPWLAAATLAVLSPPFDAPDAARIAVGVLLALLLAFTGMAARELSGRSMRWVPVLIVVGTVGLFERAHHLSEEIGLAVAVALALYGVALALRRPVAGGVTLGVAVAAGFLASGWIGIAWTLVPALLLPALGEPWRARAYAATLAAAIAVAAPLVAAWPWALHERSPALFDAWRAAERLSAWIPFLPGSGRANPGWLAKNLLWVAWPALPLVIWMAWIRGRGFHGGLREPGIVVPAAFAVTLLATLALTPEPRLIQTMPLAAPLAILAAYEVDSLKRGQSAALDWFGILTFGLAAIVLWAFWIDAYVSGMSPRVAMLLRDSETGHGVSFNLRAILAALALTLLWIVLVRPARRSNRRAILNWAAGMTLIWGLIATIWMPYVNARRTYEAVAQGIALSAPAGSCIERRDLGLAQRAALYYHTGVITVPDASPRAADCAALLVQYGRLTDGAPPLPGYTVAWQGGRRGEDNERFVLYRKGP